MQRLFSTLVPAGEPLKGRSKGWGTLESPGKRPRKCEHLITSPNHCRTSLAFSGCFASHKPFGFPFHFSRTWSNRSPKSQNSPRRGRRVFAASAAPVSGVRRAPARAWRRRAAWASSSTSPGAARCGRARRASRRPPASRSGVFC